MTSSAARWTQRLLFAVGFMILGYCGADWYNARMQQTAGNQELDRMLNEKPATANPEVKPNALIPEGSLVGKVEIPKLHLSAVVFQGTTDRTLDRGVGHLNNSALPGEPGNVVLAAHRDSYFRSLRDIKRGDEIDVVTESGPRKYEVESTTIVDPTEVSVAQPTPTPSLTLITCYPFYYVGHAPKRFIVRARDTEATSISASVKSAPLPTSSPKLMASLPKDRSFPRIKKARIVPAAPVQYEEDPSRLALPAETAGNMTYVYNASN